LKQRKKQPKTYDGVEKYILRKAFDVEEQPYLPKEVYGARKSNSLTVWVQLD
jgi:asparagine synthase (glutamine-hydrolysing)